MIEVSFDQRDVRRVHRNLIFTQGWHLMGAMASAADDAAKEVRTVLADELASKINAPEVDLQSRIESTEPVAITRTKVELNVSVSGKRIPLKTFSPTQTTGGVVYNPYVSGRAKVLRHAFGPDINRLGRHVYRRETNRRLPITKVPGLSLKTDRVAKQAIRDTQQKVPEILRRHLAKHVRELVDQQFGFRRDYKGFQRKIGSTRDLQVGRFGKAVSS